MQPAVNLMPMGMGSSVYPQQQQQQHQVAMPIQPADGFTYMVQGSTGMHPMHALQQPNIMFPQQQPMYPQQFGHQVGETINMGAHAVNRVRYSVL